MLILLRATARYAPCVPFVIIGLLTAGAFPAAAQTYGFDTSGLYNSSEPPLNYVALDNGNSTDTSADNCDECWTGGISFFNFVYYGQTFNQLQISSNGFVTFGNGQSGNPDNGGGSIPSTAYPNNTIAIVGTDLNGNTGGDVNYRITGTAPNRVLEVGFNDVDYYASVNDVRGLLRLYETTNIIEIQLGDNDDNFAFAQDKSIGIKKDAATGHQFWRTTGTSGPPDNRAIRYDPNPQVSSFTRLDATPAVSPGSNVRFQIVFDRNVSNVQASDFSLSTALPGASLVSVTGSGTTYTITCSVGTGGNGTLSLSLNDTDKSIHVQNTGRVQGVVNGPTYLVEQQAFAVANPTALDFGPVVINTSVGGSVQLNNNGARTLTVSNITFSNPVFSLSGASSFSIPANSSLSLSLLFTPTAAMSYAGATMTIQNNSYNAPSLQVGLSGLGTLPLPSAPVGFNISDRTTSSITWAWTDVNTVESGYKVYAGPGSTPPASVTFTTPANAESYTFPGLLPNSLYSAWVRATNATGDSPATLALSGYTLAEPVTGLTFTDVRTDRISFQAQNVPSNLDQGSSGLRFSNKTLGVNSNWQTTNAAFTTQPLTPNAQYQLAANSRNGEGIQNTEFTATKYTLAGPPALGNNVSPLDPVGGFFGPTDTVRFQNPAGFGTSSHGGNAYKVSGFRYAWNTNATYSFDGSEPLWNTGQLSRGVLANGAHYLHVQSINAEGAAGGSLAIGPFNFDLQEPTGSIIIGSSTPPGPSLTNSSSVTLYLTGTDGPSGSGVSKMRFSNDGVAWTPPSWTSAPAFAASYSGWNLAPGEGVKTVYVQFQDAEENVSTDTLSDSITVDLTPPLAPVVVSSTPTNDTTPVWSWVSGGSPDGAGQYRIQLNSEVGPWTPTATLNYQYSGPALSDGTLITLYVQEQDNAGNWSPSGSFTVEIDLNSENPPSVTSTSPTADTTPTWTWSSGGGAGFYRYGFTPGSWIATDVPATSYTPAAPLAEGSYTLFVQERDAANNWSASGQFTVGIDLTGPIPVLSGTTGATGAPKTLTLSFGESVFGLTSSDFQVTNGSVSALVPIGPPPAFSVTIAGQSTGIVTVVLPAGSCTDSLGNSNSASNVFSYSFDAQGPTLQSFTPANGSLLNRPNFNVDLTFDEPVQIASSAVLALSGTGAAGASVGAPTSLGGNQWRVPIAGARSGTLDVALNTAPGIVTDIFGNPYAGVPTSWQYTIDLDPPTLSVVGPTPALTLGEPVQYTVSYAGADSISLDAGDIELVATGSADAEVSVTLAKGTDQRVITLSNIRGNGTIALYIAPGTASDLAGNFAPEYIGEPSLSVQAATLPMRLPWALLAAVFIIVIGAVTLRRRLAC